MAISLLVGGALYYGAVFAMTAAADTLVPPVLPLVVAYTVCLTVLAVVGHIVIAVLAPKDANAPQDERERQIFSRAAQVASYVIGAGILVSLFLYVLFYSGDLLFHMVFGTLMLAQIVEYAMQIRYFRTSV
ncbi:MAG: hypothetical protein AAGD86_08695 [Pseudomonadota bacterium]